MRLGSAKNIKAVKKDVNITKSMNSKKNIS
jgi:hypothetical protein